MSTTKKVRVLICDDSLFMRAAIAKTLASGPFDVVGQAKDGNDALAQIPKLQPDVITMDFNMPGMNGAETVRAIMAARPTPVVMFSAHTKQGAKETFDALAAGAVDFVTKPAGEVSVDLSKIADELTRKLIAASVARPRAAAIMTAPSRPSSGAIGITRSTMTGGLPRLCVVAVSTGGPAALSELIPALPGDLRLALIVVQHMPAGFTAALAERLDAASKVSVREAQNGDRPLAGGVLIAPGDRHLEFDERGMVILTDGPQVNGCRPAADVTMMSAAKVYGRRTLAVVMTGMGKDGAAGALAIKKVEGKTAAQDQQTSVIYGMPKAAVEAGAIDEVLPLADIAGWMRYA
ncbi:MAG: chemotaxis response regulator protein-glutamate methylesterase [Myxococcota bacterium]|nr:chemotaxis response regulator protein-glutamate methylesterase [Deltaproteobacteria bacterium]MDQ3335993.1 chemotaxis response regulator protein-glutamate methylesterase [Myxococcota bacterium]